MVYRRRGASLKISWYRKISRVKTFWLFHIGFVGVCREKESPSNLLYRASARKIQKLDVKSPGAFLSRCSKRTVDALCVSGWEYMNESLSPSRYHKLKPCMMDTLYFPWNSLYCSRGNTRYSSASNFRVLLKFRIFNSIHIGNRAIQRWTIYLSPTIDKFNIHAQLYPVLRESHLCAIERIRESTVLLSLR